MENSKKYSLNVKDGKRILLGAGIALGGALVAYITDLIPNVDFGSFTPVVVALASVLVNAARKWIKDYSKSE